MTAHCLALVQCTVFSIRIRAAVIHVITNQIGTCAQRTDDCSGIVLSADDGSSVSGDLQAAANLDFELAAKLREAGVNVPKDTLTVEEMAVELCRLK